MTDYDFLYDKDYYGKDLTCEHSEDRQLSWTILKDVVLLPYKEYPDNIGGGLIDRTGNYIDCTGIHAGLGCGYFYEGVASERIEPVVFLGIWPNIWGHCLTDNIRRLWVLENKEFMENYGGLKFVYIPYGDENLIPGFKSLLKIIGIDRINLEPVNTITKFKEVILPDECFRRRNDGPRNYVDEFGTRLYTAEYKELIEKIRAYGETRFVENGITKIYLSCKNRRLYNELGERKLELYFKNLGYEIIVPEEHSFEEQLNIFLNCSDLASSVGSAAHNIMFLRDHTRVCLIPRTAFIPEYQLAIDTLHDIEISYIDSTLSLYVSKKKPWTSPVYYIISDQLQKFFGTNQNYKVNRIKFRIFKYMAYSINEEMELSDYYRDVAERYLQNNCYTNIKRGLLFRIGKKLKLWKILSMMIKKTECLER